MTPAIKKLIQTGIKRPFPTVIDPMLCSLASEPPEDDRWVCEVKWDGYRIMAHANKGRVALKTRGSKDYSSKYPEVVESFSKVIVNAVFDGEVVVFDEHGNPDFNHLQNYKGQYPIAYYAFDLIWVDGYDIMELPLVDRQKILKSIIPKSKVLRISETFPSGKELLKVIEQSDMEGIVCKMTTSTYRPGRRGNEWLKVKTEEIRDYVIGGYTESESRQFKSLLFGAYIKGKFTYIGHSGGGFTDATLKSLYSKLKKLEIKDNPFTNHFKPDSTPHWVKPQLVADFKIDAWNKSGSVRHPAVFMNLRTDKKPKDVIHERAVKLH